jgi:pimeloyl-ACP methyl ester carboxylesterase
MWSLGEDMISLLVACSLQTPAPHEPASPAVEAPVAAAESPRFTATVTGSGPDVVLIPGLASAGAVWEPTARRLAAHHRVHVLEVAGFAGTRAGVNASGPVIEPLTEAVDAYLAELERPTVIGHSMGGLIGLMLASRHPEHVGSLLVVDTMPYFGVLMYGPNATVDTVRPRAAAMRDQLLSGGQELYAQNEPQMMKRLVKTDGPAAQAALAAAVSSDHRVVAQAVYDDLTLDVRGELAAIRAPVTLIYPYDPGMGVPPAAADSLSRDAYKALPGVKFERIDGSFHFVMIDQPDAFARAVDTFLGD